jgi:hypothetical protein
MPVCVCREIVGGVMMVHIKVVTLRASVRNQQKKKPGCGSYDNKLKQNG